MSAPTPSNSLDFDDLAARTRKANTRALAATRKDEA